MNSEKTKNTKTKESCSTVYFELYILCRGEWVRDFRSMGVECLMQIGVSANQKADKITHVTLSESDQWIECALFLADGMKPL